jgi:hypothetical protein
MSMTWELKHSVVAGAGRQAVWEFISDVANLARLEGEAVESITRDGPFQTGSRGTTVMRGGQTTHWRLTDVHPPERATTELELDGAVVRFVWTYEELATDRTRLDQQIVLEGPRAAEYVPIMEAHFAPNVAAGMERLAREVARHAAGG